MIERILIRFDNDLELFLAVRAAFLQTFPDYRDRLLDADRKGDSGEMGRISHSLKGAISNFTDELAFQIAQELETKVRSGDVSSAHELVSRVVAAATELNDTLRAFSPGDKSA